MSFDREAGFVVTEGSDVLFVAPHAMDSMGARVVQPVMPDDSFGPPVCFLLLKAATVAALHEHNEFAELIEFEFAMDPHQAANLAKALWDCSVQAHQIMHAGVPSDIVPITPEENA